MDLEILKHAKDYIEKMANGINPLTGEKVPDSDLINNIRISRCLFYVNGVLSDVLLKNGRSRKTKKLPFTLDLELLGKFAYTGEDLSISKIVQRINVLKSDDVKNLKATDVCDWLISVGLLEEVLINGSKRNLPTETGKSMGMYTEHRIGNFGEYDIVLYKREMQEFIIDNFQGLMEFLKGCKDEK